MEQAQRGYEIASAQFREGLGSRLELTDAEVALRQSEFNYAQAVYDALAARAAWTKAVGIVPASNFRWARSWEADDHGPPGPTRRNREGPDPMNIRHGTKGAPRGLPERTIWHARHEGSGPDCWGWPSWWGWPPVAAATPMPGMLPPRPKPRYGSSMWRSAR